jgi:hypothetical protein
LETVVRETPLTRATSAIVTRRSGERVTAPTSSATSCTRPSHHDRTSPTRPRRLSHRSSAHLQADPGTSVVGGGMDAGPHAIGAPLDIHTVPWPRTTDRGRPARPVGGLYLGRARRNYCTSASISGEIGVAVGILLTREGLTPEQAYQRLHRATTPWLARCPTSRGMSSLTRPCPAPPSRNDHDPALPRARRPGGQPATPERCARGR